MFRRSADHTASVTDHKAGHPTALYDRHLLLEGAKRNEILELWEVHRYGHDSYGDPNYTSIYGMRPADWYARGVRLLGRTVVECTCDELGDAIGKDVGAIAAHAPDGHGMLVLDPFVGSANTLYWILRRLPKARALGFEQDARVFELSQRNIAALELPIEILNTDYRSGLAHVSLGSDNFLIAFIAPPWGAALSSTTGLDLDATTPAVAEIVDSLIDRFPGSRMLCAIQIYEMMNAESVVSVRRRFDWSKTALYRLNAPGQNHGVLLGTRRWAPDIA